MGKRGQIYILAAILLAVVVYGLSTVVNVVQQEEIKGDFEALSSNYETESSKLINSVLQSGGDVADSFANFTFLFTSYSKAKSPSFNLFYALAYKNELHVGNFMNEPVFIYDPCPGSVCPSSEVLLEGCLAYISAQISFEGLTIQPSALFLADFDLLRGKCTGIIPVSGAKEYCVNIGGLVYKLPVEENVPRIFSLSRLKSGDQVLYSAQGTVGEEQVCSTGADEDSCCADFCCWDEEEDVCREGKCVTPEKCDGTKPCKKCYCDAGEYCDNKLCKQPCIDGTRIGKCSTTKPKYCDSDGDLEDNCVRCDCPDEDNQRCQHSTGSCCVKENKPCDGSILCCHPHVCREGACKLADESDCENNLDDNEDGKIDCNDPQCEGRCSINPPKRCINKHWVDDCNACPPCPSGYTCQSDGSCVSYKTFTCRKYYTDIECDDLTPECDDGWNPTGEASWLYCSDCCDCTCLVWCWGCDDKYAQRCYQDRITSCTANPFCLYNEGKEGESNC